MLLVCPKSEKELALQHHSVDMIRFFIKDAAKAKRTAPGDAHQL
jgi:hypothetical protein